MYNFIEMSILSSLTDIITLMTGKRVHFVGIGGSGISGVAHLASLMGYEVTGCDLEDSTSYSKKIFKGHSPNHVKDVDLVVATPAVFFQDSNNREISKARKNGVLMTWQEFLGNILLKDKKLICIAGTHGKSTTTAMVGKILIDNGFDPIVVLGAIVPEWGGTSRYGVGEYAVVEADEFNDNFLNYHPDIAVINNIEFDHPDYFKSLEEINASFEKFKKNLVGRKLLITQDDSPNKKFNLKVLGEHNQKNANMAFMVGKSLGIDEYKVIQSLQDFKGIGRRTELIADRGGIRVYDDYAHHPTAIRATINGLREHYKGNRIIVIDEPHGFARTKSLLDDYKGVFDGADMVYIGPIFKARDKVDKSITPELVAKKSLHKNAVGMDSFEDILNSIRSNVKHGDIILVMGAGKSYLWAREIVDIIPVKFSDLTTLRVGGHIKKYVEVNTKEEIPSVVSELKKLKLPLFILGGGSDILASDKDFKGAVIKFTGDEIKMKDTELIIGAGASWDAVVKFAVENNLSGIECLSGIPGTVGAAPIQNIGAYGQELKDVFVSLEAFDVKTGKFFIFSNSDCKFGYRESIFKTKEYWQRCIIDSVTLKLVRNGRPKVAYESLVFHFRDKGINNPSLKEVREAVLAIRSGKFEDPNLVGNAGSFFKNPVVSVGSLEQIKIKYPDIKYFPFGNNFKVSAGWMLEKAGWKGRTYKSAAVSASHALVLINPGGATASDIYELSEKMIKDVYSKFGINLEREVQLINF